MRIDKNQISSLAMISLTFMVLISGCSPNTASIDRALLRGHSTDINGGEKGTVNIDSSIANDGDFSLKLNFTRSQDFRRFTSEIKSKEDIRLFLLSSDAEKNALESFQSTGEVRITIERSSQYEPVGAWIQLRSNELINRASTENCILSMKRDQGNSWRLSLAESGDCKSRPEILSRMDELLISFASNKVSKPSTKVDELRFDSF
jgi:hypothetical protein